MTTSIESLRIDPRFCGPPDVTNGGYAAGTLADFLGDHLGREDATIEVTLKRPIPLGTDIQAERTTDGAQLVDGAGELLAEARTAELRLTPPSVPDWDAVAAGRDAYIGFEKHGFPGCFVCGPERREDGLHIFAGPIPNRPDMVACPWTPGHNLETIDGRVAIPYIWAVLDCPGYFAEASAAPEATLPAVLGRIVGQVRRRPHADEHLRAIAWRMEQSEKRFSVGTALIDEADQVIAMAKAAWVRLSDPALFKAIMN